MKPWWKSNWFLLTALAALFVLVFYYEEDVRGMLAWKRAKAEIEAHGLSLDPKDYIPAAVPDAENFGALPIFKLIPGPAGGGDLVSALSTALESITTNLPVAKDEYLGPDGLPFPGNWSKGEPPDVTAIQARLLELCRKKFPEKTISPTATPAELFDLLCPTLADLRAANKIYPQCRFEHDYATKFPGAMSMWNIAIQIRLSNVLAYEERLALMSGEPARALDDFKVVWKIDSGLRKEPMLISGLVTLATQAIQLAVVKEGLAKHVWNDGQLADLDNDLGKIDCLAHAQFVTRGEAAFEFVPNLDYLKSHRSMLVDCFIDAPISKPTDTGRLIGLLIPEGWIDTFKADGARSQMLGTAQMVDPAARRVYPEKESAATRLVTDTPETSYWHDLVLHTVVQPQNCVTHFACAQAMVDEARIACRLERYRLAHGQYPETLDELMPAYGTDLPRDIMNGEAYHYRLHKDGTYILYSVAWNQTDDGGQIGTGNPITSPDWVWTNYPSVPVKK